MDLLLVDDCPSTLLRLEKTVSNWGYKPVSAGDAQKALKILELESAPRLLIIDWVMPQMEGPELIRKIRYRDPNRDRYIIMLTAKTGRDILETAFRCGADDYLSKPIAEDDLHRRILEGQKILDRQDQLLSTLKR